MDYLNYLDNYISDTLFKLFIVTKRSSDYDKEKVRKIRSQIFDYGNHSYLSYLESLIERFPDKNSGENKEKFRSKLVTWFSMISNEFKSYLTFHIFKYEDLSFWEELLNGSFISTEYILKINDNNHKIEIEYRHTGEKMIIQRDQFPGYILNRSMEKTIIHKGRLFLFLRNNMNSFTFLDKTYKTIHPNLELLLSRYPLNTDINIINKEN